MSLFLDWTETIKAGATSAWLTHSQRRAYDRLRSGWQSHQFVSLAGSKGTGKSFIARLLAKEAGYTYARSLSNDLSLSGSVVADDMAFSRTHQMVAVSLGLDRVVFVSNRPPADSIPCAHLVLDERDIEEFQHALYTHGVLQSFRTIPASADLQEILVSEATARGVAAE